MGESSTEIQALWFAIEQHSLAQAKTWCAEHGFDPVEWRSRTDNGATTHNIAVIVQPDAFADGSFRTIADGFPDGISATVGTRKSAMPESSRAWSRLSIVKAYEDGDQRMITGIASTPTPDRMEDVVEPGGAKFTLPIPLLAQHNHDDPIGMVEEATVTDKGIEIVALIAKDSGLDYVERAWRQLKAGLVRGLSIGFRPLEFVQLKDSYGYHILEWDWFELSAVTIPANTEATITTIKAFDFDAGARPSGLKRPLAVSGVPSRAKHAQPPIGQAALDRAMALLNGEKDVGKE